MLNWDEIEKKTAYKQPVQKVVLPKAQPKLPKLPVNTSFGSVLDEYNTSLPGIGNQVAKNLAPERKQEIAQGTQRFFEKAPVQAGYMQGVSLNDPIKSLERKLGTDINTEQAEKSGYYKAGEIGGIMTQFALPYAGASKGIAAGLTKLPKYAQLGKLGQGVAKSVTTDLAVGLPLNVNYAYNKEGLQGKEAAKSIALNTGIDLITGGILEAVPMFLKSGKKVASKADFDTLPPSEKTEVMSELERLAYESNVRKGKITPQNDTLYGNSFRPTMGELPAPKVQQGRTGANIKPIEANAYHGSLKAKDIKEFKPSNSGELGRGLYFSKDKSYAEQYAVEGYGYPMGKSAGVINLNIDKLNLKTITKQEWIDERSRFFDAEQALNGGVWNGDVFKRAEQKLNEKYISEGYDGLYVDGEKQGVIFPEKINSVKRTSQIPSTRLQPKSMYANAVGQREVPRTITPNELPKANKVQPQPLPQAPTKPAQPILPQKGTEIPKEQPFAQNGNLPKYKDLGADTFKGEKTTGQLVDEYGAFPKGEAPRAREIDVPKKTDYGDVQQHVRTLQESAIVDDTLFKDIDESIKEGTFTKFVKKNQTAVEDASRTIEINFDDALDRFRSVTTSEKTPTSYDVALGNRLLQELQKQGKYEDALSVATDLSQILSETGRTLQAARIAKRLSPEGRLMMVTKTASRIERKTGGKVKLSDDTIKKISEATTEKEIVEANQKAATEMWNQIPANWIDKANAWRYMAMLFNPKTHVRNIVGNSIFVPARAFKNAIGAAIEKPFVKLGDRTKAVLTKADKDIVEFARKDFDNVKSILKNEGKIDDNFRPYDAKVFDKKGLEAIRKLNLNALDAEDTWFMKFAYDGSLAQYMKANKLNPSDMVGEALDKGRKYAMNEALKATYRDFNAFSAAISRTKRTLAEGKANTAMGSLAKKGASVALEGIIPFAKTPVNILRRGFEYSPVGLVDGIVKMAKGVKSGKATAAEAIDTLATGLSGSSVLALGVLLGYQGIVKGKEGEYSDKAYNYDTMQGSQNYSLDLGSGTYTIDWAAPLSMPFFVGVELAKAIKEQNADLGRVLDSVTAMQDPLFNLTMLQGINDILKNNYEGMGQTITEIGLGYAGQYNPTLFGQVARTVDTTRRTTTSTNEIPLTRQLERFGRKQVAKLPVASMALEPYVDLWGREQKSGNFAENFLSPGYWQSDNVTSVDKAINRLRETLDEETAKKIIPRKTSQYEVVKDKIPYRMNEKELTQFQKTRGKESYRRLELLFNSSAYHGMSSSEKSKAISKVYDEAFEKAKSELLK